MWKKTEVHCLSFAYERLGLFFHATRITALNNDKVFEFECFRTGSKKRKTYENNDLGMLI